MHVFEEKLFAGSISLVGGVDHELGADLSWAQEVAKNRRQEVQTLISLASLGTMRQLGSVIPTLSRIDVEIKAQKG